MTDRAGSAIVAAVMLSLAAGLIAHALLVSARHQRAAARARVDVTVTGFAAQHGAAEAVRLFELSRAEDLPVGAATDPVRGEVPGARYGGRLLRLSEALWLAEGWAEGDRASRRTSRPMRVASPRTVLADLAAVVVTGGTAVAALDGAVVADRAGDEPDPAPPDGCAGEDGAPVPGPDSAAGAGLPEWRSDPDSAAPAIAGVAVGELASRSSIRVRGSGSIAPRTAAGACLPGDWSWGDPRRPGGACASRLVDVTAADGTRVEGGAGQGLLVGEGDLVLRDVNFYGLVLTEGSLTLAGSSSIVGAAHARGGIRVGSAASIVGSACWVEAAVRAAGTTAPRPIDGFGWMRW